MIGSNYKECNGLVVALDHHFVDVRGRIYTELAFGYEYWREYLDVFDEVHVLARVGGASTIPPNHFLADGPGISFLRAPEFSGPYQLLLRLPCAAASAWRAATMEAAYILRSGNVSNLLWLMLMLKRKPYARELQGIVGEAIKEATKASHPFVGPLLARVSDYLTRLQVRWASHSSYVSEACRRRYPAAAKCEEFIFSSVRLDDALVTSPRSAEQFAHAPLRLISVGRLELEKGHHVLIEALAAVHRRAPGSVTLTLVGGGSQLRPLRQQIREIGLSHAIEVAGPVHHGPPLFELLDAADLFVLPSLTEGMPRAMIEAMARGLPVIGSRTGGIEELLEDSQLTPPNSYEALAAAITARLDNPELLARESRRDFEVATTRYSQERMRREKHRFWTAVASGGRRPMAA